MTEADLPGGELRASDADRDAAVERLAAAAGDGRLSLEEYSGRTDRALAARTRGDLEGLTRDLAPTAQSAPAAGTARLLAVFGNETRKGRWRVPERLAARSVFGDCHVELQDASVTAPVTSIAAQAIFGAVTIVVPEGVEVRLSGWAVFGTKESRVRGEPAPGAPVIEVHASVLFGAVNVRTPRRKRVQRPAVQRPTA